MSVRLPAGARVVALLASISALTVVPSPAHAGPPAAGAVVRGVVEDALLHPISGAAVVIHDAGGHTVAQATTGADGLFSFPDVPLGDYTVEASFDGLMADHEHVQINSTQLQNVELVLVNSEEVITIHEDWSVPAPSTASGSTTTVARQQLDELPGSETRPVTDVIATQPGFVGDSFGAVYARGTHAGIQYQIDGIPVPESAGSLFASSIPVRLIESLEAITGGMPAEYGRRLGAVVNLTTRRSPDHPEGTATMRYGANQTAEPGFSYTRTAGPIGMFVGGSFLYSQRALEPPSRDHVFHDTGESGRVFARFDYQPCDDNKYEVFTTYAHNRFEIPLDPTLQPFDPARPRMPDQFGNDAPPFVPVDTNATETEDDLFVAFSYIHRLLHDNGTVQVAPIYKLSRGVLLGDARHALGETADPGATTSDVTRLVHHAGGVLNYTLPHGHHTFKTGLELDGLIGHTDFTAYARDDASGALDASATEHGHDRTQALTSSLYAQDRWKPSKLVLDLGLRLDEQHVQFAGGNSDDTAGVSPRAGASVSVTKDVVVHAFTGILWQPPAPLDAANAARVLGVVAPGSAVVYDLRPETDAFGELGVAAKLAPQLSGTFALWGRYAWNQLDDTQIGSTNLVSNYNFRRGRAVGAELGLESRIGPWLSLFGNLSLELAQGRGIATAAYLFSPADLASDKWQTLDHAQTATANAGATVRDGRFTATTLASYGSGLRTGPANDQHVPGHVRVDLATAYTFSPHGYPIRLAVDVENLFDARYAYRIANGFVGSAWAPPRSAFVSLSLPLSREPHRPDEKK